MQSEFILSKISYRSIFKLLLIPSLFFMFIMTIYSINNPSYLDQYNQITQEIDPQHEFTADSKVTMKIHSPFYSIVIGSLGLNIICSFWVWLCLKIYFLFFRLKIKATLVPVVHDQKDAPVDEPPPRPHKT